MTFTHKFKISAKDEGKRIDQLCGQKFPEISRTRWQELGKFVCDKKEVSFKTKTKEGQSWSVSCEEQKEAPAHLIPWEFPLKILAESKTWVAIEKPAGISVHPSSTDPEQKTIVNALIALFGKKLSQHFDEIDGKKIPRPGLIHRLDKGTSGILLIAKTDATHVWFQKHWKEVEKTYYAVVSGRPPKSGKIEGGIARDKRDRQKMAISKEPNAKSAITFFERIASNEKTSLLKIKIKNGRTHQIRVHLSAIGFAIEGDTKYGGRSADRIFLHAQSLTFPNPDKKNALTTVESPLPKEFQRPSNE